MTLISLIGSLSATREKTCLLNGLSQMHGRLSVLSAPTTDKSSKKRNVLNARRLIELITLTGGDGADKPRSSRRCPVEEVTYTLWKGKFMEALL